MNCSEIKYLVGKLLNLAGYPAIVRECEYRSRALNADVRVKRLALYTLVTVNGLDVYFNRITGSIDGVGFNPSADCKLGSSPESTDPGVEPDTSGVSTPKRNTAEQHA